MVMTRASSAAQHMSDEQTVITLHFPINCQHGLKSLAHNKRELSLTAHIAAHVRLSGHLGDPKALVELGELHLHHLCSTSSNK